MKKLSRFWSPILVVCFATLGVSAQSFRVQCPTSTITHPAGTSQLAQRSLFLVTGLPCPE
jgi:hypothetical protein